MQQQGLFNTGQLAREQFGEHDTVLVGFGRFKGSVITASEWGAPMKKTSVPPAREDSAEALLHQQYNENRLLIFDQEQESTFDGTMPHRAIGVVYEPAHEKHGNYVPIIMNRRYDAFMYIDQTKALHPLHIKPDGHQLPETYPFNF
jgi:erythromycin esterase-like protein